MILVYGTICLDRVYRIENLPKLGGYAPILSEETFLGGEAADNFIYRGALRLAGIQRAFAAVLGPCGHGKRQ